jgi:DNA polymerase-4
MESPSAVRKIIHVDMDMFYAAVELLTRPDLRGQPVVVGGPPNSRSVVTTANYVARKYGIRSAMPCAEAARRCPSCIFLPPDFEKYRAVSEVIREVFREVTDLVEPVSLDEAYLDVTQNKAGEPSATRIARAVKKKILERTKLTASAGVASTMFVAKIASDFRKPDGLTVVPPERALAFIRPLPVIKIPGIGRVTDGHLAALGIRTVADLAAKPLEFLEEQFGSFGGYLFNIARGVDEREVTPVWERKSLGAEETFERDLTDRGAIEAYLRNCAIRVFGELTEEEKRARTVTLKLKYHDFRSITRRRTLDEFVRSPDEIFALARALLDRTEAGKVPIRLAGIALSTFTRKERRVVPVQLVLPFRESTETQ